MDSLGYSHAAPTGVEGGGASLTATPSELAADERRAAVATAHADEANALLRALPVDEYEFLLPRLRPVGLRFRQVLIEPGVPITDVYFPRSGALSMIATEQEGGEVEVGTVGKEGMSGLPLLHQTDRMPFRVFVQIDGDAWRLSAEAFQGLIEERPALRRVCLRYAQYFMEQIAQSVACNRLHTLEERCARWLLMTHDRLEEREFELTHEFLALMLGVRRAGVSVAMGALQEAGSIRYTRGRIAVLDRPRLEEASCGCYRITRAAHCRLLGEPPRTGG